MPRRPRNVQPSGRARIIAPLAIVVFAIAALIVISADDPAPTAPVGNDAAGQTEAKSSGASNEATSSKPTTTRSSYRVKPGDSFAAIAESLNIDVSVLAELNPDVDPRSLQPGQKLKLK